MGKLFGYLASVTHRVNKANVLVFKDEATTLHPRGHAISWTKVVGGQVVTGQVFGGQVMRGQVVRG